MWHLGICFNGEHHGAGLKVGIDDLKVFANLNNSMILWFVNGRLFHKALMSCISFTQKIFGFNLNL